MITVMGDVFKEIRCLHAINRAYSYTGTARQHEKRNGPTGSPWGDTPIAKDWLDVPFSLPGGYEQQGKIDADQIL